MSAFLRQFSFDEEHIIWSICVLSAFCIVGITLYTFTLIMQHLFCIPKSSSALGLQSRSEPSHVKAYSTLSVTFATLCVMFTFSTYPVCTELWCGYNTLGFASFALVLDSYILSKLFLYLLFIDCLFNPYYRCIYQYPKSIQHSLWFLLIAMMISVIIGNANNAVQCVGKQPSESIDKAWSAVYVVTDCTISIATMLLFFRPICCNRKKKSCSPSVDMSVVKKYRIISALQLIAAVSYELSFLGRIYVGAEHALEGIWSSYLDICSVVQMLDCLLLMICIYRGFARKETV